MVARDFSPWMPCFSAFSARREDDSLVRPPGGKPQRKRTRRLKPPATIVRPPGENRWAIIRFSTPPPEPVSLSIMTRQNGKETPRARCGDGDCGSTRGWARGRRRRCGGSLLFRKRHIRSRFPGRIRPQQRCRHVGRPRLAPIESQHVGRVVLWFVWRACRHLANVCSPVANRHSALVTFAA